MSLDCYRRADRAIETNNARSTSSLIFGGLIEDWLPHLLLLVNELRGFGGRHWIRIAAERCKLPLQFGVESNFAQVFACLTDDNLGRADGRYQDTPASRLKTGYRFRHGRNVGGIPPNAWQRRPRLA